MFRGEARSLERRMDELEQAFRQEREDLREAQKEFREHQKACIEVGRENLEAIHENSRACIATALGVRDDIQKTMLKAAGWTIGILVSAGGAMFAVVLHLH